MSCSPCRVWDFQSQRELMSEGWNSSYRCCMWPAISYQLMAWDAHETIRMVEANSKRLTDAVLSLDYRFEWIIEEFPGWLLNCYVTNLTHNPVSKQTNHHATKTAHRRSPVHHKMKRGWALGSDTLQLRIQFVQWLYSGCWIWFQPIALNNPFEPRSVLDQRYTLATTPSLMIECLPNFKQSFIQIRVWERVMIVEQAAVKEITWVGDDLSALLTFENTGH